MGGILRDINRGLIAINAIGDGEGGSVDGVPADGGSQRQGPDVGGLGEAVLPSRMGTGAASGIVPPPPAQYGPRRTLRLVLDDDEVDQWAS